jgi:hypothetical protein
VAKARELRAKVARDPGAAADEQKLRHYEESLAMLEREAPDLPLVRQLRFELWGHARAATERLSALRPGWPHGQEIRPQVKAPRRLPNNAGEQWPPVLPTPTPIAPGGRLRLAAALGGAGMLAVGMGAGVLQPTARTAPRPAPRAPTRWLVM